ncbi:MAG: hypothetical protein JXX29_21785 [Deltaproteobacteria bacterium]|nr:hypothetical protein [Deltaproteobacteria bacterium]MBN2674328.1 hypothetical protein [Deltaproteobacteria bacterium]
MIIIGIDENGLGPVLGPMVVTACAFRAKRYDEAHFWKLCDESLPADDSKIIFKRNKESFAETAVLRWLSVFSHFPNNATELFNTLCESTPRPCPEAFPEVCRPHNQNAIPAFGGEAPRQLSLNLWNRFDHLSITPLQTRAFLLCPGEFNAHFSSSDVNKLQLDFNLMMQLIQLFQRERTDDDEEIWAVCGKVGGAQKYLPWFHALNITDCDIIEEHRDVSTYRLPDNTTVSFIKDGDSAHLPVAVASMVGKYLRELSIQETNRLLAPNQPPVSGYRDVRTKAFIEATAASRTARNLPDRCFLRIC